MVARLSLGQVPRLVCGVAMQVMPLDCAQVRQGVLPPLRKKTRPRGF
ncbi:hypothetical protein THER5_1946 [Bifidobacterium thermacidophilum subsp. thermacidophilum]|uniref:Uncharacterized protein n=1 Tax=Bifidobacterium thermacidophilum subsp. thermacidophilum TaxID=79262 RepID=A0A087E1M8_9BIFI|nr:hypothetical protein THER5_1946 [Bifidobacterium thermacidophilum subsp. thermacidophilum]